MRHRPRAVALSISLVIAATGAGPASALPRRSAEGEASPPALSQDSGSALAADEDGAGDGASTGEQST